MTKAELKDYFKLAGGILLALTFPNVVFKMMDRSPHELEGIRDLNSSLKMDRLKKTKLNQEKNIPTP